MKMQYLTSSNIDDELTQNKKVYEHIPFGKTVKLLGCD